LDTEGEEWVSACLAARSNYYGMPVMLSSRGVNPALVLTDWDEFLTYTRQEGAFWGNVFAPTPRLYACHVPSNDDNSRAQSRACAAGHLSDSGVSKDCGIIHVVGACADLCQKPYSWLKYQPQCWSSPDGTGRTGSVITTFLSDAG